MKDKKGKVKFRAGFFVGLLAMFMTVAYILVYLGIPSDLNNPSLILCAGFGAFAFILFGLLKRKTSELAPIVLMICNLLSIVLFVSTDGMIDYLSTQFFGGFSLEVILALPLPIWFTIFGSAVSFVLSSVAMYLPMYKRVEE